MSSTGYRKAPVSVFVVDSAFNSADSLNENTILGFGSLQRNATGSRQLLQGIISIERLKRTLGYNALRSFNGQGSRYIAGSYLESLRMPYNCRGGPFNIAGYGQRVDFGRQTFFKSSLACIICSYRCTVNRYLYSGCR
ncbi:hypothetical protein D3C75_344080 [compost metagenome]